jgi:type IV conjugative transfer system protein TraE
MLKETRDALRQAFKEKKYLAYFKHSLSAVIILLQAVTIFVMSNHVRVIITPTEIREEFWLEPKEVSSSYLSQMSFVFASLMFDVTPESLVAKQDTILSFVDPAYYGEMKGQLVKEAQELKKRQISRFFSVISHEVNNSEKWVKVMGDMTTLVGREKVETKRTIYKFQYRYKSGRLFVSDIIEEPVNA